MPWNESIVDENEEAIREIKRIIEESGLTMGRIFYLKEKIDELLNAETENTDGIRS